MASRFWVGGSGTWDNSATTHWSATSGGASGASAPTAADNAFIDANSGGGTITMATTALCRSCDTTGCPATTINWNNAGILTVGDGSGGALTFTSNITMSNRGGTAALLFVSTSNNGGAGWAVTTAGKALPNTTFNGAGGKWVLQDTTTAGALTITVTSGAFFGNGQSITCGTFALSGSTTRTIDITNCTITCSTAGTAWNAGVTPTNITFTSTGSTIICTGAAARFIAGFLTYNIVRLTGTGTDTVENGGTYATLERSNAVAVGIRFTNGQTFTITNPILSGTAGNLVTIDSASAGSAATLSKPNGIVSLDYLSIKDSTATGGAAWYAGANSTNVSGNTGWLFRSGVVETAMGMNVGLSLIGSTTGVGGEL